MFLDLIFAMFLWCGLVHGEQPGGGQTADAWPSFRGNPQLTGVAMGTLPDKLEVRWKVDVKEPVTSTAAIVNGVVYVGADDSNLYAINLADGNIRWKYAAKD